MAKKTRSIKKKEHENLTDTNIKHVIELLSSSKPITKKHACAVLNIAYNTSRLTTIIENYTKRREYDKKRRKENRGKPASKEEIELVISSYLIGQSIAEIACLTYRSTLFIKGILTKKGVPEKATGDDKQTVAYLPDQCVAYQFSPGQTAWSATYHAPCKITKEATNIDYKKKYGCRAYHIYIIEAMEDVVEGFPTVTVGGFNASALAYDLGSLSHLKEFNVT